MKMPRVLITDDDHETRRWLAEELVREGLEAIPARSGREAVHLLTHDHVDVVVTDLRMPDDIGGLEVLRVAHEVRPDLPVIIMTGYGSVPSAVDAMRAGAFEYLCKPFALGDLVATIQRAVENRPGEGAGPGQVGGLIGASPPMRGVFDLIQRAAATDINVLITGESGTGKELVARAIHNHSGRKQARFVPINCAGLPETLLESELLGHVRGAFTGATSARRGLIEEAHGGTLFLDEIAEMPLVLQAKLLRVLQDKAVRPVGSNRAQVMDFRLITATNKDPQNQVATGALRDDLFFRLNVIHIVLPPLRERGADLGLLVRHFLAKHAAAQGRNVRGLSREAFALLEAYPWPGNVRELENALERAIALAQSATIHPGDLPAFLHAPRGSLPAGDAAGTLTLRDHQERYIARVLETTGGDRAHAARILGVHPRTLRRRERRLDKSRAAGRVLERSPAL